MRRRIRDRRPVMAYYRESADEQDRSVRAAWSQVTSLPDQLDAIFQTKLDAAITDRKLLAVLFRAVADPGHPLSPFSRKTSHIRDANIALFDELLDQQPAKLRRSLARGPWLVQLGLLLYLLYDPAGGKRTKRFARDLAAQIAHALPLLGSPMAQPVLAHLGGLW